MHSSNTLNRVQDDSSKKLSVNRNYNLLRCESNNSILIVQENGVLIKRLGGFLSGHPKGEKVISYSRIEAIQFYPPTTGKYGFIYLKLVDSTASNLKYLEAASNANTVIFLEDKLLDFIRQ